MSGSRRDETPMLDAAPATALFIFTGLWYVGPLLRRREMRDER